MVIHILFANWFAISLILVLIFAIILYFHLFYPKQSMPIGELVAIKTPQPEKYHNDCLHPCIRYIPEGFLGYNWWMVQSPYYKNNSEIENPILYYSNGKDHPLHWESLVVVQDTPDKGFNSDPNLFYEDNKLWIFWREYKTPLCDMLGVIAATVGCYTTDGKTFSPVQVYLSENETDKDTQQCPILLKRNEKYYFYTVNYQYRPVRKGLGIAIWEGNSLEIPDFNLSSTPEIKSVFVCDAWKKIIIKNRILFLPKPFKHDVWHIDLFEYNNKLYMFSVAEWSKNIILSVSTDYINFKTCRVPLQNNCYTVSAIKDWKYYYKATGYIHNATLYLYYTATSQHNRQKNELHFSKSPLEIIL